MSIQYTGQWAFIIGGSEGIGLAMGEEYLKRGANVLLVSRSEEKLREVSVRLQERYTESQTRYLSLDVRKGEDVQKAFSRLAEENMTPYFLINCVGRAVPQYFEQIDSAQLEETFQINVLTAWNTIQAALPYMKKTGGFIMNTSSVAGFVGVFGYSDYSITKFGLIGLSEVLRSELKQYRIQLSVLCPPDTDTPGFQEENKTKPAETIAVSANAKLMTPEAVAGCAIKAMEKGKFILLVNFESKLVWFLKRWLPGILYRIIQKDIIKVQKQKQ